MKDGFATPLILVKGGVKYRNRSLQNLIIIYIVSGFTCNNNNNNNNIIIIITIIIIIIIYTG